jgi:hypothetical protein
VPVPLYDILSLDEKNLVVRVEPMVTVGDITRSEPVLVGAAVRHLVSGREEPGGEGGAHGHCG